MEDREHKLVCCFQKQGVRDCRIRRHISIDKGDGAQGHGGNVRFQEALVSFRHCKECMREEPSVLLGEYTSVRDIVREDK